MNIVINIIEKVVIGTFVVSALYTIVCAIIGIILSSSNKARLQIYGENILFSIIILLLIALIVFMAILIFASIIFMLN